MTGIQPEHAHRQRTAIKLELATAPKVQEDLKRLSLFFTEPYETFGLEDSVFGLKELEGYRMNHSALDIVEDLDVESRHGIKKNETAKISVGYAFRGYDGEHFPEHQFDGLLGKVTNDYIQKIRERSSGRKVAGMINPETEVRYVVEAARIGARKANEAQGNHVWSLEEIVDIHNFREESIGRGYHKNRPSWDYVIAKMNEKYGEDFTTDQITLAYRRNKNLLTDEEE